MKEKINHYVKNLEKEIKDNKKEISLEDLYTKIKFYQHERYIHLLVTFFTGICSLLFLLCSLHNYSILFIIPFFITFIMFYCYIFHYYHLENGVQKLEELYFEIKKKR